MNKNATKFIEAAKSLFGDSAVLTRDGIQHVVDETGVPYPYWLVTKQEYRSGRGQYRVPSSEKTTTQANPVVSVDPVVDTSVAMVAQVLEYRQPKLVDESDSAIPESVSYTHLTLPTIYSV